MLAANKHLESLNLETNFLSGEFLAKLFKAALINQTIHEVKCVNQVNNELEWAGLIISKFNDYSNVNFRV